MSTCRSQHARDTDVVVWQFIRKLNIWCLFGKCLVVGGIDVAVAHRSANDLLGADLQFAAAPIDADTFSSPDIDPVCGADQLHDFFRK